MDVNVVALGRAGIVRGLVLAVLLGCQAENLGAVPLLGQAQQCRAMVDAWVAHGQECAWPYSEAGHQRDIAVCDRAVALAPVDIGPCLDAIHRETCTKDDPGYPPSCLYLWRNFGADRDGGA